MARLCRPALVDEGLPAMIITLADLETPLGPMRVAATATGLCAVDFLDRWNIIHSRLEKRFGTIAPNTNGETFGVVPRLEAYYKGAVENFDGIPFDPGGTAFQQTVWRALREIPRGKTWSYADLAAHIGSPAAVRAVGATNGRNPLSIVVPCHRVIGKGGELRGYAGGLDRKRWLLSMEAL